MILNESFCFIVLTLTAELTACLLQPNEAENVRRLGEQRAEVRATSSPASDREDTCMSADMKFYTQVSQWSVSRTAAETGARPGRPRTSRAAVRKNVCSSDI